MSQNIVIASNMKNEESQLNSSLSARWVENMKQITNQIIVVLGDSKDKSQEILEKKGVIVVNSNIITEKGYGEARNHLREMGRKFFPSAGWLLFCDADERIFGYDLHNIRHLSEELSEDFDVVAMPRINWRDKEMTKAVSDYNVYPDYQARMTRLNSPLKYFRKLHEQLMGHKAIYAHLTNPKINHFHRVTSEEKRIEIGKVCSKLHAEDLEYGDTYPKHKKEAMYYELYLKEGLS